MTCSVEGCGSLRWARGLCQKHYQRMMRLGTLDLPGPKPIVCECPVPDARPDRAFGECMICHRKPLALFTPEHQAIARAAGITWAPMPEFAP